ncbi:hypothetical protein SAMN03159338_1498 [Sphingomonas sp. NFR04]|uniref:hypothetical protein n=1 Tax=Sphingomonas sp. NFR04 TaxID=1566283 RepID=UPI0008E35B74|nr:hypothetical protein [Sphingomonas sp. NFR04]SFJ47614.1 hypothetical protein SAMN03159338_1498 [Sphingomonas sp. NFR04]
MLVTRHTDGGLSAFIPAADIMAFAIHWPCFGFVASSDVITASWAPNGDLQDISGDFGFEERGVAALIKDAEQYGFGCVIQAQCRHEHDVTMARVQQYLDDCDALGVERVPLITFNSGVMGDTVA